MPDEKVLLDQHEAVALLGVNEKVFRLLEASGLISALDVPGLRRGKYDRHEILALPGKLQKKTRRRPPRPSGADPKPTAAAGSSTSGSEVGGIDARSKARSASGKSRPWRENGALPSSEERPRSAPKLIKNDRRSSKPGSNSPADGGNDAGSSEKTRPLFRVI